MNCDCSADAGLSASKASSLNEHGFDKSAQAPTEHKKVTFNKLARHIGNN